MTNFWLFSEFLLGYKRVKKRYGSISQTQTKCTIRLTYDLQPPNCQTFNLLKTEISVCLTIFNQVIFSQMSFNQFKLSTRSFQTKIYIVLNKCTKYLCNLMIESPQNVNVQLLSRKRKGTLKTLLLHPKDYDYIPPLLCNCDACLM